MFKALRHSRTGIRSISENYQQLNELKSFTTRESAKGLIAANKRVANILKKVDANSIPVVNNALFEEAEEKDLYSELKLAIQTIQTTSVFVEKLEVLGSLEPNIEQYFAKVLVNCENLEVRNNRLATLNALRQLFLGVADFSLLKQ